MSEPDRIFDTDASTVCCHLTYVTDRSIMELDACALVIERQTIGEIVLHDLDLERRDRVWISLIVNVKVFPLDGERTQYRTRWGIWIWIRTVRRAVRDTGCRITWLERTVVVISPERRNSVVRL